MLLILNYLISNLQEHHQIITNNNVSDALAREVMLLVQLEKYDDALEVVENNYFRQWEGVSKAYSSYVDAYLLKGMDHYNQGRFDQSLADFQAALNYPGNMMVAEPYRGGRSAQIHYFIGMAYEAIGNVNNAEKHYKLSATKRQYKGLSEINYYQALSLSRMNKTNEAMEIFEGLIELGKSRLDNTEEDFFAKFGEKQTTADKKADAYFLMGLGYLGKEDHDSAKQELSRAVDLNLNHIWAAALLSRLNSGVISFINE